MTGYVWMDSTIEFAFKAFRPRDQVQNLCVFRRKLTQQKNRPYIHPMEWISDLPFLFHSTISKIRMFDNWWTPFPSHPVAVPQFETKTRPSYGSNLFGNVATLKGNTRAEFPSWVNAEDSKVLKVWAAWNSDVKRSSWKSHLVMKIVCFTSRTPTWTQKKSARLRRVSRNHWNVGSRGPPVTVTTKGSTQNNLAKRSKQTNNNATKFETKK